MRARLLLPLFAPLLLAVPGCGDDAPSTSDAAVDAAAPPDAAPPDAAVPDAAPDAATVAPKLRNELDSIPDDELALQALQLLGAPVAGAASNCDGCHGMSRGRIRSWADPLTGDAIPTCFSDLEITTQEVALEMIDCLRQNPDKSTSGFMTPKLGIFASAADLPWFDYLFDKAYGQDGPAELQAFREAVLMPRVRSGRPAFGQADFDVVAEWYQRGLPQLDALVPGDPDPGDCVDAIDPAVATHVAAMAQTGWRALNAEHGILMLGCAGTSDPRDCLTAYPRAASTSFGAGWESLAGTTTRILRTNHYSSSYWTRSSADGRFVSHGGGQGAGSTIIDLQEDREIPTHAAYDPGFFPDNHAFMFQGTPVGTGVCRQDLLNASPATVNFTEPECSDAISIGLYQHVGAALDGSDYWFIESNWVGDNGGHYATLHDPPAYFSSQDSISVTPMVDLGNEYVQGFPAVASTPYEGDAVLSPSGGLVISRVTGTNGQTGMRLRQLIATLNSEGSYDIEVPEIGRYCSMQGGKPAFSYDERWLVVHHYIGDEDAIELGFSGPSDPDFQAYRTSGAANIYLLDLTTGTRRRITNMAPGQYALYPHFRSDGWIYFMVRASGQALEYVVASDAALTYE
jgi:hypothetical protein